MSINCKKSTLKTLIWLLLFCLSSPGIFGYDLEFSDGRLEELVRHKARRPGAEPLYVEDVLQIEELDASGLGIESLEGIEALKNLRVLNLRNNRIECIEPLSELTKLEDLTVRNNRIQDISPLSGLVQLTRLTFRENEVECIEPLRNLILLDDLSMHSNRVKDITPLENLTLLEELTLRNNRIEDITVLAGLSNLKNVNLRDNRIEDFSPLSGLNNIQGSGSRLNLGGNHTTDFRAVKGYYDAIEDVDFIILPPVEEREVKLVINEFMASNGRAVPDEDGEYPPWLELYNAGNEPIDLTGWYLSDDADNPLQWQFPEATIGSGEHKLIFTSGKDKNISGNTLQSKAVFHSVTRPVLFHRRGFKHHLANIFRGSQKTYAASTKSGQESFFHTNFRISRDGEPVILSDKEGNIVDYVPSIVLGRNESYGRLEDGGDTWHRFGGMYELEYAGTSPGLPNSQGIRPIEAPIFSHAGGFYKSGFHLELSHYDPEAIILYTLDGSIPCPSNLDDQGEEYEINYYFHDNDEWDKSKNIPRRNRTYVYSGPIEVVDRTSRPNDLSEIITTYILFINPHDYTWFPPQEKTFKGTVLRTRAYRNDSDFVSKSDVQSQSYYIHPSGDETYSLPVVSIITGAENLFGYDKGIYVPGKSYFDAGGTETNALRNRGNFFLRGREWEPWVHMEIFEDFGKNSFSQNVGMRIHGGNARMRHQKSFRLYARDDYDKEKDVMQYTFFPDSTKPRSNDTPDTFQRILFRQGGSCYNFLSDSVAHMLMENTEVGIQRNKRFLHFINGKYWGLINARDRLDEYHLAYNYNLEPEDIVIINSPYGILPENTTKLEAGNSEDVALYNQLYSFVTNNDLAEKENYQQVTEMLCVDSFIDYNVMFIFFGNWDWWGMKHFRFWRTRKKGSGFYQDGRWRVMAWDFDFAAYFSPSFDLLINAIHPEGGGNAWHFGKPERTALITNMLENEIFLNRFINRFADHINTMFTTQRVQQMVQDEYQKMLPELDEHYRRWNYEAVTQASLNRWMNFASNRPGYQRQQIIDNFNEFYNAGIEGEAEVTLDVNSKNKGFIRINTVEIQSSTPGAAEDPYPWSGIYFRGIPIEVEAISFPGYRFAGWTGVNSDEAAVTLDLTGDIEISALFEVDTDDPIIEIPDDHLRYEVYRVLGKNLSEPLLQSDLAQLEELDLRNYRVRSLEGLQYAVNLRELNIRDNGLTEALFAELNLELLADLEHLRYLNIRGNGLTCLGETSPIRHLTQLEFLSMRDNNIEDISALAYLVNLKDLNARNNKIFDISPLQHLDNLRERLYLEGNPLVRSDYLPIEAYVNDIETTDFYVHMNPDPHVLWENDYHFNYWSPEEPELSFPDNMVFQQSDQADPCLYTEMVKPYFLHIDDYHSDDEEYLGFPYKLTRRTRVMGLEEDGIAFINTGRGRDLGTAVLALNTQYLRNAGIYFTTETVIPNDRIYAWRLQYRTGKDFTSPFKDITVNGEPVEYISSEEEGHETHFGPIAMPEEALGKEYVQLRWKYYHVDKYDGPRAKLRLDDIRITGQKRTQAEKWNVYY